MHRVHRDPERDVWFVTSRRPVLVEDPFAGEEFAVLVVDRVGIAEAAWRSFATTLMKLGARHVVYVGSAADAHCRILEWASHERFNDLEVPDGRRVVATGFAPGELDAAVALHLGASSFPGFVARRHLVMCVGVDEADGRAVLSLVERCCRGEPADAPGVPPAPAESPVPFLTGRWTARGREQDTARGAREVEVRYALQHGPRSWTLIGRLGGAVFAAQLPEGAAAWTGDHVALGRIEGWLAVVDDTALSTFVSADRRAHGCEAFRAIGADRCEVRGALFLGGELASTWQLELRREG